MHKNQSVSLCNDSIIVTTIHETYNDLMNRYNVSAQLIQRLFFLNRYNGSGRKKKILQLFQKIYFKKDHISH
jgi:hypothetical protein